MKRRPEATSESRIIGFKHATLQWNTGKQSEEAPPKDAKDKKGKKDKKDKKAVTNGESTSPSTSTHGTTSVTSTTVPEAPFQLVDLSVNFPTGKLSVVSGPTGSGKSAILTALLGEMELLEGQTYLPKQTTQVDAKTGLRNSVAYASQTPWLQQKSIKDNILFGEEFNEERYDATLEACALVPDLEMLEDGDQTEIGAKGVCPSIFSTLTNDERVWKLTWGFRSHLVVVRRQGWHLLVLFIRTPSIFFLTIPSPPLTRILPNT